MTGLPLLYSACSVLLFSLALYTLVISPHLIRKIMALNIMGSAVFLFLTATAYRNRLETPDPVPHAMVLTGIVVAVSATAFALALARRLYAATGSVWLPEEDGE